MDTFTEITTLVGIIIVVVLYIKYLAMPLLKGAPYVPISSSNLKKILEMAEVDEGNKVVDLGSGDGRVVIEFALRGCVVDGYEINPLLVRTSRKKIKKLGLDENATIYEKDFWDQELSKYDVVVLFQVPYVMRKMQDKLKEELKHGTKVISYSFKLPDWEVVSEEDNIYLYEL
jgi:tRNA A58 N-methylase Trm61